MKLPQIYQNFYLRNIAVLLFFIMIIFSCTYNDFYINSEFRSKGAILLLNKICSAIVPIYVFMTVSNTLLVKRLFLDKKYGLFLPAMIIYWFCGHLFFVWYFIIVGLGDFKILSTVSILTNGTGIYFLHIWILKNIAEGRKEMINVESELSFLKQQLNPHFLLNAMNNLYGESLSEPENVPARILNLSDMLRYQIEATKKNLVPLSEEIGFLKRYIEYYTFRNERLQVFQKYGEQLGTLRIPPLFFLPLVENAIKFSSETSKPLIVLNLHIDEKKLSFSTQNNYLQSGSRLDGTGIGIENLKRRLEVYGLKHELKCTREDDVYNVKLLIWGLSTVAL